MLSSESPPGPSCSQASALKSDEIEPPKFSIRDYVFRLRNEDIKRNWPFPQKFLQVCLKHDVKDLLPRFESHCLVRAKCCNKNDIVASSEDVDSLDVEPDNIDQTICLSSREQLLVGNLSEKETLAVEQVGTPNGKLIDGEAEILTKIINHDQVVSKSDDISENNLEETSEREVAVHSPIAEVPNVTRQRAEKKRKLIVKLNTIPQSSRAEDIGATSASVSDLMASKVCPVCKTFTSSSNTTLNAHIDQCLSEESNTKLAVTNSLKVQVKPRKKKLMVDIYKNAPLCTLEDLDKRNGTSWASDLSLVAPLGNVSCEIKKPKLSPGFIDVGNEGAVYVDSNGIKIRILSKFNDAPSTVSSKGFKAKHLKAKYLKSLKVNAPNKKLCKRQSLSEGDCHLNTHQKIQKEESLTEILSSQGQVQSLEPATLGQWVCSKRSDMSRKLRNKDFSKSSMNQLPVTKKLLSNQTASGNTSVGRKHILKLSRLSEDSAPSTTTKNVDFFDERVGTTNEKNKAPKPPVFDPLLSSFEVSKSSFKESCHRSPNFGKDSLLKKSDLFEHRCFMGVEGDSSGKNLLISKMLRKHRSIGSCKWGSEPMSCDDGLDGSVKAKKPSDHHEVNLSDDTVVPGTSDAADHIPSRTSEISEFEQDKESFDISEMLKSSSGRYNFGEKLDKQVGDTAVDEILISDNQILDAKTRLDYLSAREEHMELICGNETIGGSPCQRSVEKEQMQCDDIVKDGIINQSTRIAGEATIRAKDTSDLQLEECQTGSTCIEKSVTFSRECVGVGLEISQEKSSITSLKHHMPMNRDPSSSPDSTASTMSHPSRNFQVKDKEVVDNSASSLKNIRTEGQETQKVNIELNGMSSVKQIERFRDSQPCCCSFRESPFREPQLVRQCGIPKMASLSKGNQMSSNLHIQQAISFPVPCPCLRTNNNVSAITSSDSVIKLQNPVLRLMGKDLVVNKDVSHNHLEHSSADCAPDQVGVPWYYHHHQYLDCSPFASQASWTANRPMYFQSHDMSFSGDSPVIGSKARHSQQGHQRRSTNQPMNERGVNPPAATFFQNLMPHSSLYSSRTANHPSISTPRPIPPAKMMSLRSIPDGLPPVHPNTCTFPSPSSSDHLTSFY